MVEFILSLLCVSLLYCAFRLPPAVGASPFDDEAARVVWLVIAAMCLTALATPTPPKRGGDR